MIRKEPLIPPTYRGASIMEYVKEFRFFQEGKSYTREEIIKLIADKKGAHLDNDEKPFHKFEKETFLPVFNPTMNGIYPLATKYLIDIGLETLSVCKKIDLLK